MKKSVLSILPNFIACMPCCLRRKTRVNTIPSMRTSVSAPKFFAIRILRDFGYLLGDRSVPSRGFWRTPDLSSQSACGVVLIECSGPEPWVSNQKRTGGPLLPLNLQLAEALGSVRDTIKTAHDAACRDCA